VTGGGKARGGGGGGSKQEREESWTGKKLEGKKTWGQRRCKKSENRLHTSKGGNGINDGLIVKNRTISLREDGVEQKF